MTRGPCVWLFDLCLPVWPRSMACEDGGPWMPLLPIIIGMVTPRGFHHWHPVGAETGASMPAW